MPLNAIYYDPYSACTGKNLFVGTCNAVSLTEALFDTATVYAYVTAE
jgi:hypothetical protein